MAIKYSIHETPQPKGRKTKVLSHARALPNATKKMDDICEMICERASLSSADVKSVLDSFVWVIDHSLRYGNHVELEDLGYFSPSLRTQKTNDGKMTVRVDGVNFRCSEKLKKKLRDTHLEKQKKAHSYTLEERKNRMLNYLDRNEDITTPVYAGLNNCSYYKASDDLRKFTETEIICRLGKGTHVMYVLNENIIKK